MIKNLNKLSMKEFNLEEAKAGKPVCTRNGLKTRIICFDAKNPEYPIVALVEDSDGLETLDSYTNNGRYDTYDKTTNDDLMMVSEKNEGWINVYKTDKTFITDCHIYKTKEEAKIHAGVSNIAIAKVEWEE